MTASTIGCERVREWVKMRVGRTHATVVATVTWAALCLLVAQRVTPAAMARALPAEHAGSGRARLMRVRRWWMGPAIEQAEVSPQLIVSALALLAPGQAVVVALDTTRVGKWEVWWAGIPYPWPKGRFRSTTLTVIRRLPAAFPVGVRWCVVADRGFPSAALFAQLRQGGTDCSVRLRLSARVTVRGVYGKVSEHVVAGRLRHGQRTAATIGRGQSGQPWVLGWVVVSATVATLPRHKRNPDTLRERAKRAKAHLQHRAHKQGRKTKPPSATAQRYAQTWILFTTAPTIRQAVRAYAQRLSIEETFRDWHHGWSVRVAVSSLPTEAMGEA